MKIKQNKMKLVFKLSNVYAVQEKKIKTLV